MTNHYFKDIWVNSHIRNGILIIGHYRGLNKKNIFVRSYRKSNGEKIDCHFRRLSNKND